MQYKTKHFFLLLLGSLMSPWAFSQDPSEPTVKETDSAGKEANEGGLASEIVSAFQARQKSLQENSSIATYRGLNHKWKIVIDIATKNGKVAFLGKFDRGGRVDQQEAVFDGKETIVRLNNGVRANDDNALGGVDFEDYFTAFNGCRLPKSRIHPDKDRFPDYTVVDLIQNGTFSVSSFPNGVELKGGGVTLTLDPGRQYVITKASYEYPDDAFMDIESTGFAQSNDSIWVATHFVSKWRVAKDPFFEIAVSDISWTVPDSRFQFLLKDNEPVEDFRPYDGKDQTSVLAYIGSSNPERVKLAREEAIVQAKAAAKIDSQKSYSRTTILLVNIAVIVLLIVTAIWRRKKNS